MFLKPLICTVLHGIDIFNVIPLKSLRQQKLFNINNIFTSMANRNGCYFRLLHSQLTEKMPIKYTRKFAISIVSKAYTKWLIKAYSCHFKATSKREMKKSSLLLQQLSATEPHKYYV